MHDIIPPWPLKDITIIEIECSYTSSLAIAPRSFINASITKQQATLKYSPWILSLKNYKPSQNDFLVKFKTMKWVPFLQEVLPEHGLCISLHDNSFSPHASTLSVNLFLIPILATMVTNIIQQCWFIHVLTESCKSNSVEHFVNQRLRNLIFIWFDNWSWLISILEFHHLY